LTYSTQELEVKIRSASPGIIGRIADQRVLLDLRTVSPEQEPLVINILNNL